MSNLAKISGLFRRHPLAAVCGTLTVLLFGVFALRFGLTDEATERVNQLKEARDIISVNLHNAEDLGLQTKKLAADLALLENKLIRSNDVASNQQFFYKLESDTGVKIVRLDPRPDKLKAAEKTNYIPIPFSVAVEGSFTNALGFLQALENGPHHYRLISFNLQRSTNTDSRSVVLDLSLSLLGTP